jgi:hypothetical protein
VFGGGLAARVGQRERSSGSSDTRPTLTAPGDDVVVAEVGAPGYTAFNTQINIPVR